MLMNPTRWQAVRRIGLVLALSSIPAVFALAARSFAAAPRRRAFHSELIHATPVSKDAKVALTVGISSAQGMRPEMEDTHAVHNLQGPCAYVSVFDGHAGDRCAQFASKQLHEILYAAPSYRSNVAAALRHAFLRTDEQFLAIAERKQWRDGTTALVAMVDLEASSLTVAWAGDSRAVMCGTTGEAVALTTDHKPDREDEKKRVLAAGGSVAPLPGSQYFPSRVWPGGLAVSRALGDLPFKVPLPLVVAEPEIRSAILPTDTMTTIILACDGLWDVVTPDRACDVARQHQSPQKAAEKLVLLALTSGSTDNVSVMVVQVVPRDEYARHVAAITPPPAAKL